MKKIDKFHRHEILDRCTMVCDIVDDSLLRHPAVTVEMKAKLEAAQSLIYEAGCIATSDPCKKCGMTALVPKGKKKMLCTQCLAKQKRKK
jgi:hypothetical protein